MYKTTEEPFDPLPDYHRAVNQRTTVPQTTEPLTSVLKTVIGTQLDFM